MSDVSRFRSAINGFNRTDVVNYVESLGKGFDRTSTAVDANK